MTQLAAVMVDSGGGGQGGGVFDVVCPDNVVWFIQEFLQTFYCSLKRFCYNQPSLVTAEPRKNICADEHRLEKSCGERTRTLTQLKGFQVLRKCPNKRL